MPDSKSITITFTPSYVNDKGWLESGKLHMELSEEMPAADLFYMLH